MMLEQTVGPVRATETAWLDRDGLGRAIGELEGERRLILCLFYFERLTLDQIAAVLGETEDRVAELYLRAMEAVGACPPWAAPALAAA